MKASFPLYLFAAAALVACSCAAPISSDRLAIETRATIEMFDGLSGRAWPILEPRTGNFAKTDKSQRQAGFDLINKAKNSGRLQDAAIPSHQTGGYDSNGVVHLDRQQPTNKDGQHKIAIQLNKGNPSTIGQLVLHKDIPIGAKRLAKTMRHSILRGKEIHVPAKRVQVAHIARVKAKEAAIRALKANLKKKRK